MDSRKRYVRSEIEAAAVDNRRDEDSDNRAKKQHQHRSQLQGEFVILCFVLLGFGVAAIATFGMDRKWPVPKPDELRPADFDYRNARAHLTALTDFDARVVGSVENEILAPQYIMDQLERIRSQYLNEAEFEMQFEVFRSVGGSFNLQFLHDYISVYRNITSVVLRIQPKNVPPTSALLVNCHYDTVACSPGAGDDTSSCALMLEMARAIVSSDRPLRNAVVFLWNGAEENMLQASHAFVTQHRWFSGPPRIAAFVNLDAAGSGGREIAFQIGPENPWLIEAYAKTVRLPWASIMAQEFFESGVIPSDTDYRQFRDFGKLPGIDIAFVQNGYVYHTEFDTPDRIANESLHRAGTNMLALIREIANSSLLSDPGAQRHGKVVFYDLLGNFMIAYPKSVGTVLNILVSIVFLAVVIRPKLAQQNAPGYPNSMPYSSILRKMLLWIMAKTVITIVLVGIIGFALSRLARHNMAWYSHNWPVSIYVLPVAFVQLFVAAMTRKHSFRNEPLARLEEVHFDAFQLLAVLITILSTAFQLGSAYLPMLYCLCSFLVRNVIYERLILRGRRSVQSQTEAPSIGEITVVNICSHFLILAQSAYMARTFASLLVPIIARAGSELNTEVFFGELIAFLSVFMMMSQASVLYRIRLDRAITVTCALFAAVFAVLCLTNLGFPYYVNSETKEVYPRRIFLSHTSRVVSHDDKLLENRTYLWVTPLDSLSLDPLRNHFSSKINYDDVLHYRCDSEYLPYCGVPTIYPAVLLMQPQWLFNLPQELYPSHAKPVLKLINTSDITTDKMPYKNKVRLTFELYSQQSHSTIYVANRYGSSLIRWIFWAGVQQDTFSYPRPAYSIPTVDEATGEKYERQHYFIYYSHGTTPSEPLRFAIDFSLSTSAVGRVAVADIAIGAMYFHREEANTALQKEVRAALPEWIGEISWVTHYESRTVHATIQ